MAQAITEQPARIKNPGYNIHVLCETQLLFMVIDRGKADFHFIKKLRMKQPINKIPSV